MQFPGGQNTYQPVVSDIVKFLLKTTDGRGGRPNLAIWSASYASAKTLEREGSILSSRFYVLLLFTCFSLIHPVDELSFKEMRTWDQFKIPSGCLCVLCESKELGGRVSCFILFCFV